MIATATLHSTMDLPALSLSPPISPAFDASYCYDLSSSIPTPPIHIIMPLQQAEKHVDGSSFSWSDFPIMVCDENDDVCFETRKQSANSFDFSSSPPTINSKLPSFSAQEIHDDNSSLSSKSSHKGTKKNVRFASSLEVRTYSLVLGDHPWCEDGLALALGWDYSQSNAKAEYLTSKWSRKTNETPHRHSYVERKRLLLEVGGYTRADLETNGWSEADFGFQNGGRRPHGHSSTSQQGMTRKRQLSRVGSIPKSLAMLQP